MSDEWVQSPGMPDGVVERPRDWQPQAQPTPQVDLVGLVVNADGIALRAGPIEGDEVKEQILADFHRQLYGEDEA